MHQLEAHIEYEKSLLHESASYRDNAERRIEELTMECNSFQKRVEELEVEKDDMMMTNKFSIDDLSNKYRELEREYAEQSCNLHRLVEEKSRTEQEMHVLKDELSELIQANRTLQYEVTKQVNSYKLTVKEHHEKVRKMQEIINTKFEKEKSSAEEQRSEKEILEQKIYSILSTHNSEIERYSRDLQISKDFSASLQELLDDQSIATANAKAEVALLQSNLSESSAQIDALESELLAEKAKGKKEGQEFQAHLSRLEDDVRELLNSVEDLTNQRMRLTSQLEILENQSKEATAMRRNAEAELDALKEEWRIQRETYLHETNRLQMLLEEKDGDANSLKAQAFRIEELSIELNARVVELESENGNLNEQVRLTSNHLASLSARNDALEGEIERKSHEYSMNLQELRNEVTASQADIERMKEITEELRVRAEKSEREKEELQAQLDNALQAESAVSATLASVREDVNKMNLALTSLLNRQRDIMADHLADDTILSELNGESLQSMLDEVHRLSDSSNGLQENMNIAASYTDMLSKELSSLRYQIRQKIVEDSSEERYNKQLKEMSTLHEKTVTELHAAIKELEFELHSTKSRENSIAVELKAITTQYYKTAEQLDRTREELTDIQLNYSRIQAEVESNAFLSRDGSVASIKDPTTTSSVKDFPDISEAADRAKLGTLAELPVSLAAPPSQMLSPISNAPQLAKSPNKLGRRFRAVDDREESEITLPFRNASVIDFNINQEIEGKTEDSSSVPSLQVPHKTTGTLNLLSMIIKPRTKMLIMCDMSSTMANGGRIKAQRKCVYSLANASIENNSFLALTYWNSKLHWVQAECEVVTKHWRRGEEILVGFKALEMVTPEGGHDMRNALENAIRTLPDATDIVVVCHGITWPFEPLAVSASTHIVTNWMAFRRRNPGMKFHFIALGSSADKKGLQRMAKDGDGCFVVIAPPR